MPRSPVKSIFVKRRQHEGSRKRARGLSSPPTYTTISCDNTVVMWLDEAGKSGEVLGSFDLTDIVDDQDSDLLTFLNTCKGGTILLLFTLVCCTTVAVLTYFDFTLLLRTPTTAVTITRTPHKSVSTKREYTVVTNTVPFFEDSAVKTVEIAPVAASDHTGFL